VFKLQQGYFVAGDSGTEESDKIVGVLAVGDFKETAKTSRHRRAGRRLDAFQHLRRARPIGA
jgi:hypothetical protein